MLREMKGSVMTDDPREVLKAVGAECPELDTFLCGRGPSEWEDDDELDAAFLALATRLAAIVSYFEDERNIDSAAPWALGEIRRILAEHEADRV